MKGILEYDLPEDEHWFEVAQRADDMRNMLDEFVRYLDTSLDYAAMNKIENTIVKNVRDELFRLAKDYELRIGEKK